MKSDLLLKKGTNPELIEMFNNGLAAIVKDGTYDKIINKYLDSNKSKEGSSKKATDETTIVGLIKNNYKQLLQGLGITLGLTLLSFAIAMIIGVIFGMMAVAPNKTLRVISQVFVDVVRGIPLMIVAAFIYWGIPNLIENITGHQSPINDFVAATIASHLTVVLTLPKLYVVVSKLFLLVRWKPVEAWVSLTIQQCVRLSCHRRFA